MKKLGFTDTEIKELLEADKAIDRGERMDFDLTPEEEKQAKKLINATSKKKTTYNFDTTQKKRKENPTKGGIIEELANFMLKESQFAVENLEITNKERQIAFQIGENKYEITLTQKRKPK